MGGSRSTYPILAVVIGVALAGALARHHLLSDNIGQYPLVDVSPKQLGANEIGVFSAASKDTNQTASPAVSDFIAVTTIGDQSRVTPACAMNPPSHTRVLLLTNAQATHGSTALFQVLASSRNMADLCPAKSWQCEGFQVAVIQCWKMLRASRRNATSTDLRESDFRRCVPKTWVSRCFEVCRSKRLAPDLFDLGKFNAMETFSRYWDLSKPVLQDKEFPREPAYTEILHSAIRAGVPSAMKEAGIKEIRPAYIFMFVPLCVMVHVQKGQRAQFRKDGDAYIRSENEHLQTLRDRHHNLTKQGYPALVVNYADLLFRGGYAVSRLQSFLPCVGPMSLDFVPELGKDVFSGNRFKVRGSVAEFGKSLGDPAAAFGYDAANGICKNRADYERIRQDTLRSHLEELEAYFTGFS